MAAAECGPRLGLGRPRRVRQALTNHQRLRSAAVEDPRVRELAELMVNRCLDVQPGWQVSVRSTPLARPLVREVARATCAAAPTTSPDQLGPERFRADLDWALEAPLDLLAELPPIESYQVANEDARLTIRAPEDVYAGSQLDPERRKLLQRAGEPASRRARALDAPGRSSSTQPRPRLQRRV